jgi:hypothetical protein
MNGSLTNLLIIFAVLMILWFLYSRYENKRYFQEEMDDYAKIREYLLEDPTLGDSKKPIMWIHIPYEQNSRNWINFGSRTSMELNQPYLYLTAKSIIHKCKDSFRICMIDDNSFGKIIPKWTIRMELVASPIRNKIREMAMTKILYLYGGMIVPLSFLCLKDLIGLYDRGTQHGKMFVCQNIDRNVTSVSSEFYPSVKFMGAKKENKIVESLIDFMQRTISRDFTDQSIFLGESDRWIEKKIKKRDIIMIDGIDVGIKNMEEKPILLEDLLSDNYIDFYPEMYGIWIPADDIYKMRKYEWFGRLSSKQVLEANTILSKYIILANIPDATDGVLKPMTPKPNWVSFWNVPSEAPVWGLKPNYLGNNMLKTDLSDNPYSIVVL